MQLTTYMDIRVFRVIKIHWRLGFGSSSLNFEQPDIIPLSITNLILVNRYIYLEQKTWGKQQGLSLASSKTGWGRSRRPTWDPPGGGCRYSGQTPPWTARRSLPSDRSRSVDRGPCPGNSSHRSGPAYTSCSLYKCICVKYLKMECLYCAKLILFKLVSFFKNINFMDKDAC